MLLAVIISSRLCNSRLTICYDSDLCSFLTSNQHGHSDHIPSSHLVPKVFSQFSLPQISVSISQQVDSYQIWFADLILSFDHIILHHHLSIFSISFNLLLLKLDDFNSQCNGVYSEASHHRSSTPIPVCGLRSLPSLVVVPLLGLLHSPLLYSVHVSVSLPSKVLFKPSNMTGPVVDQKSYTKDEIMSIASEQKDINPGELSFEEGAQNYLSIPTKRF